MDSREVLKVYFGYDSFRVGQDNIINSILAGRDTLAIMPTGAGKSICYQVPALMLPGITLVISPLISLMHDQVKALNEAGIHAAYINSSLTEKQIVKVLSLARQGVYKIIYVAPERLENGEFIEFAEQSNISMITVDEAHCISQWGQDFRTAYLKIVGFVKTLPNRPVISAFTATATEEVKNDIVCMLNLENSNVVVTGFDRENLYYQVENITAKQKDDFVIDYVEKHSEESGIIYCSTRKNVDSLHEILLKRGVAVTKYHAGIDNETRKRNQDDFIYDRTPVIVATNAFGMGIDKSNVRYVIHYNMPQSIENYYQEAGRAGRDGGNSQCILLFSAQDIMIHKFLLERKDFSEVKDEDRELVVQRDAFRLQKMEGYCRTTSCLRNYILEYFGEKTAGLCDNCGNCHREYIEMDMTTDAKWVINCVAETKGRYGLSIVVGTLIGANRARLREIGANNYKSYGVLANRSEVELRHLISQMLSDGYLLQTQDQYGILRMGDISRLKDCNTKVIVRKCKEESIRNDKASQKRNTDSLTSAGFELFEKLRQLRLTIAKEEAMPPYIIFNDKTLIDMCVKLPKNKEEMLNVSGVAENKNNKYGQRFLDEILEYVTGHPDKVVSTAIESEVLEEKSGNKRNRKGDFYITQEDAENFEYAEYYYMGDIKEQLNDICSVSNVRKASVGIIWDYLVSEGLTVEEEDKRGFVKVSTKKGKTLGIETEERVSKNGFTYTVLKYPEEIQKRIVNYFVGPRKIQGSDGLEKGMTPAGNKRLNARTAWTLEEDERLVREYHSGMKMSEIAKEHGRTNGAIVARLKKHGLVE